MMSLATPRTRCKSSAISDQTSAATTQRILREDCTPTADPWAQRAGATVASVLLCRNRAAGPPAPIFPGAVDAVGAGAGVNLVHLAGGQELDLAHVHGLLLQPCIDLEVDRNIDRLPDIL